MATVTATAGPQCLSSAGTFGGEWLVDPQTCRRRCPGEAQEFEHEENPDRTIIHRHRRLFMPYYEVTGEGTKNVQNRSMFFWRYRQELSQVRFALPGKAQSPS
jgi:hypothetical protein